MKEGCKQQNELRRENNVKIIASSDPNKPCVVFPPCFRKSLWSDWFSDQRLLQINPPFHYFFKIIFSLIIFILFRNSGKMNLILHESIIVCDYFNAKVLNVNKKIPKRQQICCSGMFTGNILIIKKKTILITNYN